jgi:hypothetical protein
MPAVGQHPVRQTQARPPPPAGQGACCFLGPRSGRLSGSARTRSHYVWLSHTRRTKPTNSVGGERSSVPQDEALAADYRAIALRRKRALGCYSCPDGRSAWRLGRLCNLAADVGGGSFNRVGPRKRKPQQPRTRAAPCARGLCRRLELAALLSVLASSTNAISPLCAGSR